MSNTHLNEIASEALKVGSKEVTQKYTANVWENVEKKLSDFDGNVLDMLTAHGAGTAYDFRDNNIKILGEHLYLKIRENINCRDIHSNIIIEMIDESTFANNKPPKTSHEIVNKKSKKNKQNTKHPKIRKADQIRLDVANENIQNIIKLIKETFSPNSLTHHTAVRSDIIEIRGIGLMYCLWFMCNNKDIYAKGGVTNKKYPYVLSAIVTAEKFLRICEDFDGIDFAKICSKPHVAKSMMEDLKIMHKKAKDIYPYDGITICKYAPELLVYSEFDKCIPFQGISPRKNQKEVIEFVKNNYKTGFLLSYQAMIASGKTTCSVALISYMMYLRKTYREFNNVQFIFCCNLASVKLQVAQMCWNQKIPFAMAHKDAEVAKIINNFNCKRDSDRICIIGSPDAISLILTDHTRGNPGNMYFMFHDEPTIGADVQNSQSLRDNVTVMSNLPKWTILSSATMPSLDSLSVFTDKFRRDHPSAVYGTVYSDEIQIGCDVKTINGDLVIPHMGCTSSSMLKKIISTIKINPFLGRIYTQNVATTVWTECTRLGINGIPNIPEVFKDVNNISANNVRKYVMNMLEIVAEQSDDIITEICASPIFSGIADATEPDSDEINNSDSDSESSGGIWGEPPKKKNTVHVYEPIDYNNFGTTQAHKFLQPNLIVTHDPFSFAVDKFSNLLEYVKTNKTCPIHSAKNMIGKYKKQLTKFQEDIDRLEKRIEDEDELSKEICKKQEEKPRLQFPVTAQINTVYHIKKFASEHIANINSRFVRTELVLEDIPYDTFCIPDNILQLLFCGVGVYAPGNKMLDQNYINTVLTLAESGSLAFLVADSSICYGTNYPINRVFVIKDFSDSTSVGTWFQTMGRAGRVNRSWTAEAYIEESCAQDIIKYAHNPDAYNSEAINMIKMFRNIEQEKNNAIIQDIAKMKRDLEEENRKKNISGPSIKVLTMKLAKVSDVINVPVPDNVTKKTPEWRPTNTTESSNIPVQSWRRKPEEKPDTNININDKFKEIPRQKSDSLSWRTKRSIP